MGNKISDPSTGLLNVRLNSDSTVDPTSNSLNKYIRDWAMTNYTVSRNIPSGQGISTSTWNNQLKKRACITNNPNPTIGLPGFDSKNNFVPSIAVGIPVFNNIYKYNGW